MKIEWTDFAWQMLSQTADGILSEYGFASYASFIKDIDDCVSLLQTQPKLGKEEHLLAQRPFLYRSVVVDKLNKIVYTIDKERNIIFIVDIWDTRREPKLLISSL